MSALREFHSDGGRQTERQGKFRRPQTQVVVEESCNQHLGNKCVSICHVPGHSGFLAGVDEENKDPRVCGGSGVNAISIQVL